jgi:tRNA threonylcarbamoyladenosine biosynthesis protein TsaE
MEYIVQRIEEMQSVAQDILAQCSKPGSVHVIGLRGDLGAGKTALVKELGLALDIEETVTSPTFGILRVYDIPAHAGSPFARLAHMDAYRLDGEEDLAPLGWDRLIADATTLVCVEWPERIVGAMPEDTLYIDIAHVDETTRRVNIK